MSDDLAQRILIGLLARDPLLAQRFTDIETRLVQLSHLAQHAARIYQRVERDWQADAKQAAGAAAHAWDYVSTPVRETPVPAKLQGAATVDVFDLFPVES